MAKPKAPVVEPEQRLREMWARYSDEEREAVLEEVAKKVGLEGLSIRAACDAMGVVRVTFYRWLAERPEMFQAWRQQYRQMAIAKWSDLADRAREQLMDKMEQVPAGSLATVGAIAEDKAALLAGEASINVRHTHVIDVKSVEEALRRTREITEALTQNVAEAALMGDVE